MANRYEFVRPTKGLPSKRKRGNALRVFIFILFLAAAAYIFYNQVYKLPAEKELSLNKEIADYTLECFSLTNSLIEVAYKGPQAEKEAADTLNKVKQLKTAILSSSLIHRAQKPEQLDTVLFLYEGYTTLEDCLNAPIDPNFYKKIIPILKRKLEVLRLSCLKLNLPEETFKKLKAVEVQFNESKIFKPKQKTEVNNKRRGLGIVSFSFKPKYISKNENGYFVLPKTEMLDLTVEVQNQGEIDENNISISLSLISENGQEPLNYTEYIDNLKKLEKKPVTFVNIPLKEPYGTLYTATIFVKPVEGESVTSNNTLELNFLVSE